MTRCGLALQLVTQLSGPDPRRAAAAERESAKTAIVAASSSSRAVPSNPRRISLMTFRRPVQLAASTLPPHFRSRHFEAPVLPPFVRGVMPLSMIRYAMRQMVARLSYRGPRRAGYVERCGRPRGRGKNAAVRLDARRMAAGHVIVAVLAVLMLVSACGGAPHRQGWA